MCAFAPIVVGFIWKREGFAVDSVDVSIFLSKLSNGLANVGLVGSVGFVAEAVEDLDARICDRVVTGGDHASRTCTEGQHGAVEGRCSALANVDDMAAGQPESEGEGRNQRCISRTPVPAHHDHLALARKGGPRVGQGFAYQSHEGWRQGPFVLNETNGFLFVNGFETDGASNAVGAEERGAHGHPSPVLTVGSVDTGNGRVGPHRAVAPQHHAGVGDAVTSRRHTFAQHRTELSQAAWKAFAVQAHVNFTSVVAKVAEFGPRS